MMHALPDMASGLGEMFERLRKVVARGYLLALRHLLTLPFYGRYRRC